MKKIVVVILMIAMLLVSMAATAESFLFPCSHFSTSLTRATTYDGQVTGEYLFTEQGITVKSSGQYIFWHTDANDHPGYRYTYMNHRTNIEPAVFEFLKQDGTPLKVAAYFRKTPGSNVTHFRKSDDGTLLVLDTDVCFCVHLEDENGEKYSITFIREHE